MICLACNQDTSHSHNINISRCNRCGLVHNPIPPDYDLNQYNDKYVKLFGTDREHRINMGRVGAVMRHLPLQSRILDYGCSCGNFIARAEDFYECVGFEPCAQSIRDRRCRSHIVDNMDNIVGQQFDMVTLFDVIEHFPDPKTTMETVIHPMVKDRGYILLTTPNPTHVVDIHQWYHLWPGQHMYLWTPTALNLFMAQLGYRDLHCDFAECFLRNNDPTPNSILTMVFQRN
jgi:SAM-dependent methyltransferase